MIKNLIRLLRGEPKRLLSGCQAPSLLLSENRLSNSQ
jgi:hypothetical protein